MNDVAARPANPHLLAWSAGNYLTVGSGLQLMSELLAEALDLRPGQRVLDVAGGTGNAALAAARRWCQVTGTDFVAAMLGDARRRAAAEGLTIEFETADAQSLPYADASFDVVMSAIGAMFAPNHAQTAAELVRVCRSGGKIGLTCWTPTSSVARMSAALGKYLPAAPAGMKPPVAWGDEGYLRELFGKAIGTLHISHRKHLFKYPSPTGYVDYVKRNYGPTALIFKMLPAEAQANLTQDLIDQVVASNLSGDASLLVPADYLEVVITKAAR